MTRLSISDGGGGSGGGGGGGGGQRGQRGSMEGTTRRHDKMRQSLIGQTLGKRRSIGTKSLAKSLAPSTPRPEGESKGRPESSTHFDFREEGEEQEEEENGDFR